MNIHQGQPVLSAGVPLDQAKAAMIMLHQRGATAESILSLMDYLPQSDFAYLAPQAAGYTWYPYSFLAPVEQNEPYLSSALAAVDEVVQQVIAAGIPSERIILLGFSQGACLALEYAARHPQLYGGIIGFSGGLIGSVLRSDISGSFEQTPVFLGCSDMDSHVPAVRVNESAAVFQRLNADVTKRFYPQMGHTINQDELTFTENLMGRIIDQFSN